MRFITGKQLQREYGLSFKSAELIVSAQTTLARRRYRRWYAFVWTGFAAALACTFAPNGSPFYRTGMIALPCVMLCASILEWLIQRRAQVPIRAAAQAAAATA
jgi:hypothetical protein